MPIVPLIALCFAFSGQQPDHIATGFVPSRDLPSIRNTVGHGAAINGMCNGIDELSVAYYHYRQMYPNAPGLNKVTALVMDQHGAGYLKNTLETATLKSFHEGVPESTLGQRGNTPDKFTQEIVTKLQTTHEPQSIILGADISHRVTVYGATKTQNGWVFQIADSNHIDKADQVTLSYDRTSNKWQSQVGGVPTEKWTGAGVVETPIQRPKEYWDMMTMALQGKSIPEIREKVVPPVPSPTAPPKSVIIQKDPKAGGIIIRFDPTLFDSTIDEAKLADLEERARDFLARNDGGAVVLQPEKRVEHLTMVPLSDLAPDRDLAGLTRVLGFSQLEDGTVCLAGLKEPGKPPIPGEFLAFALQTVYAQGRSPYISLDPDPATFMGPQKVRIGDVPEGLRNTAFIKTMLDADYEMKRINLGKEDPAVPGFKRWVDLMEEEGTPGRMRMWLSPLAVPVGDAYVYRKGKSVAVFYQSQVETQSEQEKLADESHVNVGAVDHVANDAAALFTQHFDELAAKYSDLYRLYGVFDVTKLCATWRALKLEPVGLRPWLAYRPKTVAIPAAYAGIGPEQSKSGRFTISGGAIAHARIRIAGAVETERLAPMLATDEGPVDVELPSTMLISDSTAAAFEAQGMVARATKDLGEGLAEDALNRTNEVLELDPEDLDARLVRAVANYMLNRFKESLDDLDPMTGDNPVLLALRANVHAEAGDSQAAKDDADRAESLAGDDTAVLTLAATARVESLDLKGAVMTMSRLRYVSPANPYLTLLDNQVVLLAHLGPERAKDHLRLVHEVPPQVGVALSSPTGEDDLETQISILKEIQAGIYQTPADLYVPERLTVGICSRVGGGAGTPEDLDFAVGEADKLVENHPDWASGRLAQLMTLIGKKAPPSEVIPALERFAAMEQTPDPILDEILAMMQLKRFAPQFAVLLWMDPGTLPEDVPKYLALARKYAAGTPGGDTLDQIARETDLDPAALMRSSGQEGFTGTKKALADAIAKAMRGSENLSSDDPVYPFAMTFSSMALTFADPKALAYGGLCDRALSLASHTTMPRLLDATVASTRASAWISLLQNIGSNAFPPDSAELKAMDVLGPKLDRLSTQASSKDSLASVRKTVGQATALLEVIMDHAAKYVAQRLTDIRSRHGGQTADRIEFGLARFQSDFDKENDTTFKKLAQFHPGLAKTPEYAKTLALQKRLSKGLFIAESESSIWTRVLTGIRTRFDGLSVEKYLEGLQGLARGSQKAVIDRYIAQARVKTELGALDSLAD